MGRAKLLPSVQPLSLVAQIGRMGAKHPHLGYELRRNVVTWSGLWHPDDLSDKYRIRLRYHFRRRPIISILNPRLVLAPGYKRLPHTYGDGQLDICVHRPEEWDSKFFVADMIMPWISQWIFFYETWRQTGAWLGKGTHPDWPQHSEGS